MNAIVMAIRLFLQVYADRSRGRASSRPPAQSVGRTRPWRWVFVVTIGCAALLPLSPASAFALFDPIVQGLQNTSTSWFATLVGLMQPTFLLLATIEICWAAAIWVFEKDNLSSLAVEIIKKIMLIGLLVWLMGPASNLLPVIGDSFQTLGQTAAGTGPLSTDGIIDQGLKIIGELWVKTAASVVPVIAVDPEEIFGTANPVAYAGLVSGGITFIMTVIATLLIAASYVMVAAQYFCLKVEASVLGAAGAVFLALGVSSWTKDYVMKYLNYAIGAGVRLMVLILLLSLTMSAVNQMAADPGIAFSIFTFDFKPILGVMAAALLQCILAMKAPEMVGALLSGGSSGGLTPGSVVSSVLSTAGSVSQLAMLGGLGKAAGGAAGAGHGAHGGNGSSSLNSAVRAGYPGSAGGQVGQQADRAAAMAGIAGLGRGANAQPSRAQSGSSMMTGANSAAGINSRQGNHPGNSSGASGQTAAASVSPSRANESTGTRRVRFALPAADRDSQDLNDRSSSSAASGTGIVDTTQPQPLSRNMPPSTGPLSAANPTGTVDQTGTPDPADSGPSVNRSAAAPAQPPSAQPTPAGIPRASEPRGSGPGPNTRPLDGNGTSTARPDLPGPSGGRSS